MGEDALETEPCVSGCGCSDFMQCYCDDCAVSPRFDAEAMALFHAQLEALHVHLTPLEEARAFDAALNVLGATPRKVTR